MTARAGANLWDDQTNLLYGLHKALGFTVLLLMLLRLVLKLRTAAPAYPASLAPLHILVAKTVHGVLYLLLFAVPLLGWAGVTAYPALITVAGYHLPPMPWVAQNEALAKQLFAVHGTLAFVLAALVICHIAAALVHLLFKRDGVFERMWPGKQSKPR
jgi:cytochrome b561